jgi:hypothetical protein
MKSGNHTLISLQWIYKLYVGERLWPNPPRFVNTIAEGIKLQQLGHLTWPIILDVVEKDVFTVVCEKACLCYWWFNIDFLFVVRPVDNISIIGTSPFAGEELKSKTYKCVAHNGFWQLGFFYYWCLPWYRIFLIRSCLRDPWFF